MLFDPDGETLAKDIEKSPKKFLEEVSRVFEFLKSDKCSIEDGDKVMIRSALMSNINQYLMYVAHIWDYAFNASSMEKDNF